MLFVGNIRFIDYYCCQILILKSFFDMDTFLTYFMTSSGQQPRIENVTFNFVSGITIFFYSIKISDCYFK